MFLLYVRLLNRDSQSSSPQKKPSLAGQKKIAQKANQQTIEHLRQVKSNHALERRIFL